MLNPPGGGPSSEGFAEQMWDGGRGGDNDNNGYACVGGRVLAVTSTSHTAPMHLTYVHTMTPHLYSGAAYVCFFACRARVYPES